MRVPETRESLLIRVKDADDALAWDEFAAIYRPAIYRLGRRRGLQDADAEDVAQRVLMTVAKTLEQWQLDRERGRFRNWLFCVARNAITNALTRRKPDRAVGGSGYQQTIEQLQHSASQDEILLTQSLTEDVSRVAQLESWTDVDPREVEMEYRRSVFRRAAEKTRPQFGDETWSAFWLTAVDECTPQQAAEQLGKNVGAIYTARFRVMQALKREVNRLMKSDQL